MPPERSTRGKRVVDLEGSDAEGDEEFWGHGTWAESSDDEVYSTEEEKPDMFDSDFNETEDEISDDDKEEATVRRAERSEGQAESKRKAVYKEPSVKKKAALAAAKAAAVKAEKVPSEMALKAATGPTGGAGLYDEDPLASAEGRKAAHKRPKNGGARSMRPRSAATGEVLVDTARSMRGSTVNRSKSSEVNRRRAHAREASIAKARQASAKPEFKTSFAQEELLTEAVETEKANLRWLLTAQRAARAREVTTKGPGRAAAAIRVGSSRSAPTTVTFSEVDAQPSFFRSAPALPTPALLGVKSDSSSSSEGSSSSSSGRGSSNSSSSSGGGAAAKRGGSSALAATNNTGGSAVVGRGVCAVTGTAAKYVDPLTGLPYADLAAFQAIRKAAKLPTVPARRL